jgi:hypothetical protein
VTRFPKLRYHPRWTLALCWIGMLSLPSLRADDPETWKKRFLDEAPPAWEEYRAFAQRLQGTRVTTVTKEGKVRSGEQFQIKHNAWCKLVLRQELGPERLGGEVFAFNPVYGFELKRKTGDAPWVLADLQMGEYHSRIMDEYWPRSTVCTLAAQFQLSEILQLPNFRVVAAGAVQRDGRELCRIDFESKGKTELGTTDARGTLWLDPERCWTVCKCTLHQHHPGLAESTMNTEVIATPAKYPIPIRYTHNTEALYSQTGKRNSALVTEFDLKEVSPLPGDEEFTLSAFGLPEPVGVKPPQRPRAWLWLLAAAAGLAALAVLFAGLKRRAARRAAQAPPSPNRGAV